MNEPSVLDYLKSKLAPWRGVQIDFPADEPGVEKVVSSEDLAVTKLEDSQAIPGIESRGRERSSSVALPWRVMVAVGLSLMAQRALEPPDRSPGMAIGFYLIAAIWLIWAIWKDEVHLIPLRSSQQRVDPLSVRREAFVLSGLLLLSAFLLFGGNRFNSINVTLWLSGLAVLIYALWLPHPESKPFGERIKIFIKRSIWEINITRWHVLFLSAFALAIFFRIYQLNQVPPEMFSDHAEKLLDVQDLLHGQTKIFFARNTGREAMQFYLTAAIAKYLGTGISFTSLKIGTILAGILTLPFIYLLGKEMGNRRVGLLAMSFAGIGYWPNVIARVGLRFPLYPLFVAPVLYFILRGLRTSNRNDFIWAGLALGIGLHGYSPIRILPVVVVAGFVIFLFHRRFREAWGQSIWYLLIVVMVAIAVFLPLGRFALENPGIFNYRTMTRLGDIERPLPGPAASIFLKNFQNGLFMFNWDDGETWVHTVVHRPALDIVSGAFFLLGLVFVILRYIRNKDWSDLFILVSIPLLMLPSLLSLAFPNENPSLVRAGGALVPVFVLIGFGMDHFLSAFRHNVNLIWRKRFAFGIAGLLLIWSSAQNFDLVFHQYYRQFLYSSWNTSEMGAVVRSFTESVGNPESAWVIAFPYWVDTRLVGINAGYPAKDLGIWPEDIPSTLTNPGAKLFLVKPEDVEGINSLENIYPQGTLTLYTSKVDTQNFMMYFVPPSG